MKIQSLPTRLILSSLVLAACLSQSRADDPTLQRGETAIDTSPSPVRVQPAPNDNTVLTFEDEFTDGKIDSSRWNKWYPWPVVINRELQAYVLDAFEPLDGGGLRIREDKRPFLDQKYTAGSITTAGKFLQAYGYFEVKARMPKGRGFWPAFWIFPPELNKQGGAEIDVFEILMHQPDVIHTTLHSTDPKTGKAAGIGHEYHGPDTSDGYHTYAVSWRPKDLVWLVDGKEVFRVAGDLVPTAPEYMLLNVAIGGAWPPPPDSSTPFPSYMDIKYVKVYQYKDLPATLPPDVALGGTTVSADPAQLGGTVDVTTPLIAGTHDLPPMLARVYLTDYYGKKFLTEQDAQLPSTPAGQSTPIKVTFSLPQDWVPGVDTVAIKLECPTNSKLGGFVGNLYRLPVTLNPASSH